MVDNTNNLSAGDMAGQQLVDGTPVFDAADEKVGSVSEHNIQGEYLVVHKGIFHKDVYVPLSAVGRTDANGVYLNLYKDEMKNQNWENPPTGTGMAASTPMGTQSKSAMPDAPDMAGTTTPTNRSSAMTPDSATGTTPGVVQPGTHPTPGQDGDVSVPVREEELIARKQSGEAGRVNIHKETVEEPQTLNIPVTREEVTVERVPAQGSGQQVGPDAFQDRDIEVPVMGEEVTTEKRARVGEEIHLHKQQVTEQERFSDTVRKERVNIEGQDQSGTTPLAGSDEQTPANP
ncbi:MAG: DUF2382 domain-containing protein [Ktedonobacterales bacterium]